MRNGCRYVGEVVVDFNFNVVVSVSAAISITFFLICGDSNKFSDVAVCCFLAVAIFGEAEIMRRVLCTPKFQFALV